MDEIDPDNTLRGKDYLDIPLIELFRHPDFNPKVLRAMVLISSMTSEDIATIDLTDWMKK